jgi:replicative DNA helicase
MLDLIAVDYLQLMRAEHPTGNRVEAVSGFSRRLKHLARQSSWSTRVCRPALEVP